MAAEPIKRVEFATKLESTELNGYAFRLEHSLHVYLGEHDQIKWSALALKLTSLPTCMSSPIVRQVDGDMDHVHFIAKRLALLAPDTQVVFSTDLTYRDDQVLWNELLSAVVRELRANNLLPPSKS